MIDMRQGYALACKVGKRYAILTDHRKQSTRVLVSAFLEPIQERLRVFKEEGETGLVIVKIVDQTITEVPADAKV